jgi:hypothetical protein
MGLCATADRLIYMHRSYSSQVPETIYPWMYTDLCGSAFASAGIYTMKSFDGNEAVETTVSMRATRDPANAHSIQVRWQSTDLEVLSTPQPVGSPAGASGIRIHSVASPITIIKSLALTFCNSVKYSIFRKLSSNEPASANW